MSAFPREGWLGYKILCARTLNDNQMALNYLDSLMDYHHSVGSCYPANHLLKAQFMEQMGRFEDACEVYKSYAHINDSIRSAELDEQLSKYTVQFEVDKLEHDKLELRGGGQPRSPYNFRDCRMPGVDIVDCYHVLLYAFFVVEPATGCGK